MRSPRKLLAQTIAAAAIAVFWCISAVGTTVGTTVGVTTLATAVNLATATPGSRKALPSPPSSPLAARPLVVVVAASQALKTCDGPILRTGPFPFQTQKRRPAPGEPSGKIAAEGHTHIECHCPRCHMIRLRPISWLSRISLGRTIAQLSTRLRCAECGGQLHSVKPWRLEDVFGKPLGRRE